LKHWNDQLLPVIKAKSNKERMMRFASKIIWFYFIFTVVMILPIGHYLYQTGQKITAEQIQTHLQERADYLLDTMDRILFERQADTQLMALSVSEILPDVNQGEKAKALTLKLQQFLEFYQIYSAISVYDYRRHRIADTSNRDLNEKAAPSEWMRAVYEHGDLSAGSEIVYDPHLQATVLIFAAPVHDVLGHFWGAVVAKVPVEILYHLLNQGLSQHKSSAQTRVLLVERNGQVLYDNKSVSGYLKQSIVAKDVSELPQFLGKNYFYVLSQERGYLNFKGNGWRLIMQYPQEQAFAANQQLRNQVILAGGLGFIIAFILLFFLTNRLVQPLRDLRNAVVKIGSGNFNHLSIPVKGKDEIAELALTFNGMVQLIQAHINMLQQREQEQIKQNIELTEKTKTLLQTTEELKQFKTCLDLLEDGVFLLDSDHYSFLYVNEGAARQLGYSAEELVGKSPKDVDVGVGRQGNVFELPVLTGEKESMTFETRNRRADNSEFPTEIKAQRVQLNPNHTVIIAITRDISERYYANQRLQEQQVFLSLVIENIPHYVFWKDRQSRFLGCNKIFAQTAGVNSPEELLGKTDFDLHWQEQAPAFFEREQRIMNSDEGEYYIEEYLRTDGALGYVEICKLPLHNAEDKVIGLLGMAQDITERKHAEQMLEQAKIAAETANRAKSRFLANMSHELRTPLNGILGYAQILLRDRQLSEKQRDGVQIIQRSGDYLLTLINDILDLSKIEADSIELYCVDFDLLDFISTLVEVFKIRAEQKGIAFIYESITALPSGVHADEKRLRQILMNLLGNAVKFTHEGGVTLKVGYDEGALRFEIFDTGQGIAESDQERIFLPFQQVGHAAFKAEGTGLGLTITRRLVDMMRGQLTLRSQLGQGSCFTLILPAIEVSHLIQSKQAPPQVIVGFREAPKRLLIVDDRAENRSVLVNLLQPLGFQVETAEQGAQALAKIKVSRPDAVLTDLVMPVLDGFEMVRQLRQSPDFVDLPVLAVSASVFEQDQAQSLAAGCNVFLPKPIQADVLLKELQKQLKLTWIYETISPVLTEKDHLVLTDTIEQTKPIDESSALTPEQATLLYDNAMMGDVSALLENIDEFKKIAPTHFHFFEELRILARGFEMDEICERIDSYREINS
jgi:PAS domain S-box-containing protein